MNPPVFKRKSLTATLDYMAWSQPFVIQFSNQLALVQPLPLVICLSCPILFNWNAHNMDPISILFLCCYWEKQI